MRSQQSLYRHRFTHFTDALIPVYNRLFEVLAGQRQEAFRAQVIELAALGGDEWLLDAGCGTGLTALRIAVRYPGCMVHGIDISPKMIAVARQDAEKQGLAVTLFVVFLLPVLFVRNVPQAVVMMLLVGAANSGITLVRDIVLSDVIDEDELHTGRRREGGYFGVNAFIERLVMVLIGGSTSVVLGLSGYNAELTAQPPSVALGIRLGMGLLPIVALAIFLAALRFYPLGKEQVVALRGRLEALHLARNSLGGDDLPK